MAKRISGNVSVRLTYLDEDNVYKCIVSSLENAGPPIKVYVNPPAYSTYPVDSSEAYDRAASAAIAFAGVQDYALTDDQFGQIKLTRKR